MRSHKFFLKNRLFPVIEQLCIPLSQQKLLVQRVHVQTSNQSHDRLYALLRARYYWGQMYADCRNQCRNCTECLIAKSSGLNRQLLTPIRVGNLFDTWTIDILKINPDAGYN